MSVGYRAVQWSAHKRRYDLAAGLGVVLFLAAFIAVSKALHSGERAISDEVLAIRALGACALTMLHLILAIGPLARLFPAWLIVHANRRHLGVMTFLVALAHGVLSIGYFHGFGTLNPLVSLLTTTTRGSGVPFELLGLAALGVLLLLAATSHDFWLRNLGSAWWKALHMLVYAAYALLVAHVVFGALASGRGLAPAILLAAGSVALVTLHLCAARVSRRHDRPSAMSEASETLGWLDAGPASELALDRPRAVRGPQGERIAVVRHARGISAVAGVCAHQGGRSTKAA